MRMEEHRETEGEADGEESGDAVGGGGEEGGGEGGGGGGEQQTRREILVRMFLRILLPRDLPLLTCLVCCITGPLGRLPQVLSFSSSLYFLGSSSPHDPSLQYSYAHTLLDFAACVRSLAASKIFRAGSRTFRRTCKYHIETSARNKHLLFVLLSLLWALSSLS